MQSESSRPPRLPKLSFTYMNWHVEVIRFERISHLPKSTQGIISVRLFKAERLVRFAAFLREKMKWKRVGDGPCTKHFTPHPAIWWWDLIFETLAYLGETLWAPPVSFRDVVERRDEAESVVAVVTAVTQQQPVLLSTAATHHTHNQIHLQNQGSCDHWGRKCRFVALKWTSE